MIEKIRNDSEAFELRLPLWAVTDEEGLQKRGLPGALRIFVDEHNVPFLDLFTKEDIAKGYLRKAAFSAWRAVALDTPALVRSIVAYSEQRGCFQIGIDCTGRRTG